MAYEDPQFGQGDIRLDADFFDLPLEERVHRMAWSDSCPIVEEVVQERGLEASEERYGQLNKWFRIMVHEAEQHNPDLAHQLVTPLPRRPDEPVGKYEPDSVPSNHAEFIAPMSTIYGWALTRILLEQFGLDKKIPKSAKQERMWRGIATMHDAIKVARDPYELLARMAEGIACADVDPKDVLKNILRIDWYREHNARNQVTALTRTLADVAPTVWKAYLAMPSTVKAQRGIINLVTDLEA
jgi:hypothetical protein